MKRTLFCMLASVGLIAACNESQTTTAQALTDQGCVVSTQERACDPDDPKKTTVCHIPPGNPANAHTICVGNPSVDAHLDHGDILGSCSCPGGGDGSDDDGDDHGDDCDAGVDSGSGSGSGSGDCGGCGSGSGSGSGSGDGSGSDGTIL